MTIEKDQLLSRAVTPSPPKGRGETYLGASTSSCSEGWSFWLTTVGLCVCIGLMAMRAYYVLGFNPPVHLLTTGFEEESLYNVWKALQGLEIYSDPFSPPYSAAYFNWLFYFVYGHTIKAVLFILNLGPAWIPTIGRLVTMFFAIIAVGATYRLLSSGIRGTYTMGGDWALAAPVLIFIGPFAGFWALTVRPDVAGVAFEVMALGVFLRSFRKESDWLLAVACLIALVAWSFKQSLVTGPGAMGLCLIAVGRWRQFALLVGITFFSWATTYATGGEAFRRLLIHTDFALPFSLNIGVGNLLKFMVKISPLVVSCLGGLWLLLRDSKLRILAAQNPKILLGSCGLLVWCFTLLPASAKIGASDNYHFTAAVYLALLCQGFTQIGGVDGRRVLAICSAIGWGGMLSAVAVAFLFRGAVLNPGLGHVALSEQIQCLKEYEGRRFISKKYLALPWILGERGLAPKVEFFGSSTYDWHRLTGQEFVAGGGGGLIKDGRFDFLALPSGTSGTYDQAELNRYALKGVCGDLDVFVRMQ